MEPGQERPVSARLFHELTRVQLNDEPGRALVVVPVGAIEQHGPDLPVGTDLFIVEHLAHKAAGLIAKDLPVVLTPAQPFGSSHHHLPFGGTMSLSSSSFFGAVEDLVRSLVESGFRMIFLLNGHGGNDELLQVVARDVSLQSDADVGAASYWTIAWEALVALGADRAGELPGHAGAFEASLMLLIRPELVGQAERDVRVGDQRFPARERYRLELHGSWQSIDGYTDEPRNADAERGRAWVEATVEAVAATMLDFYESSLAFRSRAASENQGGQTRD
jgi:creatinine amidohydrolase